MNENRRNFSRVKFESSCTIKAPGLEVEAALLDISLKGALVHLANPEQVTKGETYELTLGLNDNQLILSMRATLVFHKDVEGGFEFHELDIDTLTHLRRLVELNYGDSDKVKNELFFMATHKLD